MTKLEEYECCEADDGYIGEHPRHIKCPGGMSKGVVITQLSIEQGEGLFQVLEY